MIGFEDRLEVNKTWNYTHSKMTGLNASNSQVTLCHICLLWRTATDDASHSLGMKCLTEFESNFYVVFCSMGCESFPKTEPYLVQFFHFSYIYELSIFNKKSQTVFLAVFHIWTFTVWSIQKFIFLRNKIISMVFQLLTEILESESFRYDILKKWVRRWEEVVIKWFLMLMYFLTILL